MRKFHFANEFFIILFSTFIGLYGGHFLTTNVLENNKFYFLGLLGFFLGVVISFSVHLKQETYIDRFFWIFALISLILGLVSVFAYHSLHDLLYSSVIKLRFVNSSLPMSTYSALCRLKYEDYALINIQLFKVNWKVILLYILVNWILSPLLLNLVTRIVLYDMTRSNFLLGVTIFGVRSFISMTNIWNNMFPNNQDIWRVFALINPFIYFLGVEIYLFPSIVYLPFSFNTRGVDVSVFYSIRMYSFLFLVIPFLAAFATRLIFNRRITGYNNIVFDKVLSYFYIPTSVLSFGALILFLLASQKHHKIEDRWDNLVYLVIAYILYYFLVALIIFVCSYLFDRQIFSTKLFNNSDTENSTLSGFHSTNWFELSSLPLALIWGIRSDQILAILLGLVVEITMVFALTVISDWMKKNCLNKSISLDEHSYITSQR